MIAGREMCLSVRRATGRSEDVAAAVREVWDGERIDACAVDGPLRPGLAASAERRPCEQVLTLGVMGKRCRPGEVVTPQGFRLHEAATAAARMLSPFCQPPPTASAAAVVPVAGHALCETFPAAFIAVLLSEQSLRELDRVPRYRKTGWLYRRLLASSKLRMLLRLACPGAACEKVVGAMAKLRNRDEQAAAVCAIAAACFAQCQFAALGERSGGYIVLPPASAWDAWARDAVAANIARLSGGGEAVPELVAIECGKRSGG